MPRFVLPLLLALAGLVLLGQGAYIHAKALLAQVLLERAFDRNDRDRPRDEALVMGGHLAGRAHRGEADRCQRHRARGHQRTGARVRAGPCRADARCRRARRRGLFRAPRYAFPLSEGCRRPATKSMSREATARRSAIGRTHLGGSLRRLRHRSAGGRSRTGAFDLLAVRRGDAGTGALSAARHPDRVCCRSRAEFSASRDIVR